MRNFPRLQTPFEYFSFADLESLWHTNKSQPKEKQKAMRRSKATRQCASCVCVSVSLCVCAYVCAFMCSYSRRRGRTGLQANAITAGASFRAIGYRYRARAHTWGKACEIFRARSDLGTHGKIPHEDLLESLGGLRLGKLAVEGFKCYIGYKNMVRCLRNRSHDIEVFGDRPRRGHADAAGRHFKLLGQINVALSGCHVGVGIINHY